MDRGKYFSQLELIRCSGFSRDQVKLVEKNKYIEPLRNPVRYVLTDVIYCRMVFHLREIYSFQQLKKLILSTDTYGGDFLIKKYGLIKGLNELQLLDNLPLEIIDKLEKSYYFSETKQLKDKFSDRYIEVECCYIDLEGIRVEVIDRAYRYGITSMAEKFV